MVVQSVASRYTEILKSTVDNQYRVSVGGSYNTFIISEVSIHVMFVIPVVMCTVSVPRVKCVHGIKVHFIVDD
jgi:hypothetical protein